MKSNYVLQNKRAYSIAPDVQKILAKTFNKSHKDDQWQHWVNTPERHMLPSECKFCGSHFTVCRRDIFECVDCESFLGKAFS